MSSSPALAASNHRSESHTAPHREFAEGAAYLAAPLWALQAVIWPAAPKVQEAATPFAITKPLHFVLFWLSIAGAVGVLRGQRRGYPRSHPGA